MSRVLKKAVGATKDLGHATKDLGHASKDRFEKTVKHKGAAQDVSSSSSLGDSNQLDGTTQPRLRETPRTNAETKQPRMERTPLDGTTDSRMVETPLSHPRQADSEGLKRGRIAMASGVILTGKQEHYLKRELISQQTQHEINQLNSPTALRRFGAPFRSDAGEVAPEDSDLPLLRYIFVHHVRNFPFLDQAREKEFWQDKLQVFLESFAKKHISSSEDRLEETKRRKLAGKAEKLVELMMVSGIPTASGYEERIRFSEIEVVDRGANEDGLVVNIPEGHEINGWDINVAAVRTTMVKRTVRFHQHAEFIIRVKERGQPERYVARRFGQFAKMHKQLRLELPGKVLPPLPRKNKSSTGAIFGAGNDDDADSISSVDSHELHIPEHPESPVPKVDGASNGSGGFMSYLGLGGYGHRRASSTGSGYNTPPQGKRGSVSSGYNTPTSRVSTDSRRPSVQHHVLYREDQRVSLRAFLRTFLQNEQIAQSKAMLDFLSLNPIVPNREEWEDIARRIQMDAKRIEDGKRFYEIARRRAKELDVHMEKFRRDIVEHNGLTRLFREIRQKETIAELSPEYQKFTEWLRIEVAATIYHVFLAEDNSPELFAQAKRIHSLIPYTALKNVIRFANPAAVMKGVLDLFLAQPLGARSLMQRIFGLAISDGIKSTQKTIDTLHTKINDHTLCDKIKRYTEADEAIKEAIRKEAVEDDVDIMVVILRSEEFPPELKAEQIGRIFNAYVAWNNAVENVDQEMREGAELFAHLKQYLKLVTRQRDKQQMLSIIEEPVTLFLFRDLFTIFYEPLVRVYKSANVYNSVTDFSNFIDDMIKVIESAQRQDVSADPNQTVQAFIDLCARHEQAFYRFVHEVHIHDNGLFDQLMTWLEGILEFLRKGPKGGKLDMNALLHGALDMGRVDRDAAIAEIDSLVTWQTDRKKWHHDKTRRKMAGAEDIPGAGSGGGAAGFTSADFGLDETDIQALGLGESDAEEEREEDEEAEADEDVDPIVAERRRRVRVQEALKSRRGEPVKPPVRELGKLREGFLGLLRGVLAD